MNLYRAITGVDPNAPPVPVTGAYSGSEGATIAFSSAGSADPNGKAITYLWSFGDGATSTAANPSHVYADNRPGNAPYDVTLTVTDASNRSASTTVQAAIVNAAPVVSAAPLGTVSSGAPTSVVGSFSDAGANDSPWSWTASASGTGDAGVATTQGAIAATVKVCSTGPQSVILTVTDKDGGVGSAETPVTVVANAMSVAMPQSYNLRSNGTLPVRIYGSQTLDVASIDLATVRVSGAGVSVRNNGTFQAAIEDSNGDGRPDLVVHIPRDVLGDLLPPGTTPVAVSATLTDHCTAFAGSQPVVAR